MADSRSYSPTTRSALQGTASRTIERDAVAGDDVTGDVGRDAAAYAGAIDGVTEGIPTKTCAHCGTAIAGRWQRRFCSDRCRAAAARRRRAGVSEDWPDRTGRPMNRWHRRQRDALGRLSRESGRGS